MCYLPTVCYLPTCFQLVCYLLHCYLLLVLPYPTLCITNYPVGVTYHERYVMLPTVGVTYKECYSECYLLCYLH